jgi:hypothetical protein
MKDRLATEVRRAAASCGVALDQSTPEHAENLRRRVSRMYAHGAETWMWESLDECVVLADEAHWETIGRCVGAQDVVLFFNGDDDRSMFRFRSGEDLAKVLGECFRFEYYVTNDACSYFIAVNHHNVIHAVGDIEECFQQIKYGNPRTTGEA